MNEISRQIDEIRTRYRAFAETEARGRSPLYHALAMAIAESDTVVGFLTSLPDHCRQPNLLLASLRHVSGLPSDRAHIEAIIDQRAGEVRSVMLSRTTQTNEPGRCAVILPVLAALPEPLALIEVGASAGLCLLPDRYVYDYGTGRISGPRSGRAPVLACSANTATPIPTALPEIAWRAGLDLNPLSVRDDSDVAWLEALIWPGQDDRVEQHRAAIALARKDPPTIVRGDLLTDLEKLAEDVPAGFHPVVFHTAVLAYVREQADRDRFAANVRAIGATWISNESPRVFPKMVQEAPPPPRPGCFLLAIDGRPVAWTDPHGKAITWFGNLDS
ncbi:MAG: DUF2332 domain-containing protein [Hyphomicrobiaceae bacterium]